MNGKVSKMLKKMQANDKRSKRLYQTLTPDQKGRVRAAFEKDGENKALIEMMKYIGNIR